MSEKLYYSVSEVSKALGVHPETVRIAIRNGNLLAIKLSASKKSRWRIHKDEIRNFLYQRTKVQG